MVNKLIKIANDNTKIIEHSLKLGTTKMPKTLVCTHEMAKQYKNKKDELLQSSAPHVSFEKLKTDDCAIKMINNGAKSVTIMNFASRHTHGGGYMRGAKAQEEDLCRVMPQLYSSLSEIKYPYDQNTVLITPNVIIMRNNQTYDFFPSTDNYVVNVVSAAAPNLAIEVYSSERIKDTLENLFMSVKHHLPETDTLILGAWGCGAYGNDPNDISEIMGNVIADYHDYFPHIVISVPNGPNCKEFEKKFMDY